MGKSIRLLAAMALLLIGATIGLPQLSAADRPNIVFLLADDLGYGDLGCYGHPVIKTPNLDRLAGEGMRLTHCYAASPNCSPARAGLLTGRTPYRVGLYDYRQFRSPMHLPAAETTVAEILQQAGYQTALIGKWHLGALTEAEGSHPAPDQHGFDHWLAASGNFGENPEHLVRNGQPAGRLEGYGAELVVAEAVRWMENDWNRDLPFCLFVWFSEPHRPIVAPERTRSQYRTPEVARLAVELNYGGEGVETRRKASEWVDYFGAVSLMDEQIGRLMAKLDALSLRGDTLVYFASDNGPDHRSSACWGTPGALRGAKTHVHEGGIRVPGILRWPGRIAAGTLSDVPVNGTDLLPTLCAAADAAPPEGKPLDGVNILPVLTKGKAVERVEPLFWCLATSWGGSQVAMRQGDHKILAQMTPQGWKQDDHYPGRPPKGVSLMAWIKSAELDGFSLYNLRDDPSESTDLAEQEPRRLAQMKAALLEQYRDVQHEGPTWPSIEPDHAE